MKRFSIQKPYLAVLLAGVFCSAQVAAQPLSGTYTINPGLPAGATNFQSFSAAASALNSNGVSAAVTINVAPGTYNEQVLLNAITGASAANSITIAGAGATISTNSVNPNDRALIKLNGADYVHINGLILTATGNTASEYGYGIQLMNGADYNTISGCTINTSKTSDGTATPNYAGIVINSSDGLVTTPGDANCNYNTIRENTISGGYYGIALVAQATTFTINGNRILNNTILDFYRTGIYLNGTVGTQVDNNDIARPSRPGTSFFQYFGLNIEGGNSGLQVTRNKLHDPFGENAAISQSSAYAMYINGNAGSATAVNLFANNIIYNMNSNGIVGGFDVTNAPYNSFINNTVNVDDAGSSAFGFTKGISIIGANNQIIYNNCISIRRGGFGTKHCIYLGNTTGTVIDNNNYYVGGGTTGHTGYMSGNRTTLSDWQTTSGFDGSSIAADPQYIGAGTGNLLPGNTALQAGIPVTGTGIGTDINGLGRNATTPTLGAFEINGVVLPVTLLPLKGKLDAQNNARLSWGTLTETNNAGFEIERSADGRSWSGIAFVSSRALAGNSTERIDYIFTDPVIVKASNYYRLKQVDKDGVSSFSNTIVLNASQSAARLNVSIYPNPAQNLLRVAVDGATATGLLVITDLNGRQIKAFAAGSAKAELDIHDLMPGIYSLHYTDGQAQQTVKFVKSK